MANHVMSRFNNGLALCVLLGACGAPERPAPVVPPPPPPPRPITTAELQQVVDGAARLNRACRDSWSESGLYLVRLTVEPDGRVSGVEPRRTPARQADPSAFAGVPRYLDGDKDPDTEVVRCFVKALGKLRFRRFSGDTVAFDYPIVVENLPPSEAPAEVRRCESDEDCLFRPRPPCACPPCGRHWRLAVNRDAIKALREKWRRQRRRLCRQRRRKKCPPCDRPVETLGKQALCLDGQCGVR